MRSFIRLLLFCVLLLAGVPVLHASLPKTRVGNFFPLAADPCLENALQVPELRLDNPWLYGESVSGDTFWTSFDPDGLKTVKDYQRESVDLTRKYQSLMRLERYSHGEDREKLHQMVLTAKAALEANAKKIERIERAAEFSQSLEGHILQVTPADAMSLDDSSAEFMDIDGTMAVKELAEITGSARVPGPKGVGRVVGGEAGNAAGYQALKDSLRAAMSKPLVSDPTLARYMNDLYRGGAVVGSGSTAAAVRAERIAGVTVGGKLHTQKAKDYVKAIAEWLHKNPKAAVSDRAAAENVMQDMINALNGK